VLHDTTPGLPSQEVDDCIGQGRERHDVYTMAATDPDDFEDVLTEATGRRARTRFVTILGS